MANRWMMMVGIGLVLAACGSEDDRDLGTGDPRDLGAGEDLGRAVDAGPPDQGPPDMGPEPVCSEPDPGGDCTLFVPVGRFGPLTSSCLPRCSAETAAAYRACDSQRCRNEAVNADTTQPLTPYFLGTLRVNTPMDCATCVGYQEFHCFSLVCQSEVDAYVDHCLAGVRPELCDSSIFDIDDCLAGQDEAGRATLDQCFASADGPQGCFACE